MKSDRFSFFCLKLKTLTNTNILPKPLKPQILYIRERLEFIKKNWSELY